jgi:hypothetical protein
MQTTQFGKYAIIDTVTHNFEQEDRWWWKIKPPSSGDELNISKFLTQARIITGPDGIRREYPPTNVEIMHREIALTFGGTNIPATEKSVEEGGDPIVKVGDPVEIIEKLLCKMPNEMVIEIWEAVGEAIVEWGPRYPKVTKKKVKKSQESSTE